MKRLVLILGIAVLVSFALAADPIPQLDNPTVVGATLTMLPQINWRSGDMSDYDNVVKPEYLGSATNSTTENLTPNGIFFEAHPAVER